MLEYLTGRVPRELKFLNDASTIAEFRNDRKAMFERDLAKAFDKLDYRKKQSFIANLDKLIGFKQLDNSPIEFEEASLDAGLIYKDNLGSFKALSLVAFDSLLLFLLENIQREVRPVSFFVCSIVFLNI